MGRFDPRGVNPQLVRNVREALDREGFSSVRIVASGGFNVAKIASFEEAAVTVDAYGVGSALIRGENDFTADVVVGRPSRGQGGARLPAEPPARARSLKAGVGLELVQKAPPNAPRLAKSVPDPAGSSSGPFLPKQETC